MLRLVISNRKGGTAKSVTSYFLAGTYAERGARVLLVDCDAQGSASIANFGPIVIESLPAEQTIAALFGAKPYRADDLIHPTSVPGIAILPANVHLAPFSTPVTDDQLGQVPELAQFLAEVEDRFDVAVVDTPPSLQRATAAALTASDWVVVPLAPEEFSANGLIHLVRSVEVIRQFANPRLRLLGYLISLYDVRLSLHKAYEKALRDQYGDQVFAQRIHLSSLYKEAIARRTPITRFKPRSPAAEAFRILATEIDARVGGNSVNASASTTPQAGTMSASSQAADLRDVSSTGGAGTGGSDT